MVVFLSFLYLISFALKVPPYTRGPVDISVA